MKKRGFTLIELMIVIAIIAILASILVPNFVRARAQSQYNSCIQSIKNISAAAEMYRTDNDAYPTTSGYKVRLTPDYIRTWPLCPSSGTELYYGRCEGWGAPYTKEDFYVSCIGYAHKEAGITTVNRPQYYNRWGWYLK